jgi:hypothetical protein
MALSDTVVGVVQRTVDGKHGPYAVVSVDSLGNVTFALDSPVWTEKDPPQRGEEVILSDIRKKRAGWRAHSARFRRPSDSNQ